MRSRLVIAVCLASALGGVFWYGMQRSREGSPGTPTEMTSQLSDEDYQRGDLRAEDAITRRSPTLEAALEAAGLKLGSPVFIRIFKESRELEIWIRHTSTGKFRHFRTWKIAAMSGGLGPKQAEGDRQAPEGFYYVTPSAMKPDSSFHLAFNIGYPNAYDLAHGRTGSFIMVHGNRVSVGCFAMTDNYIEEIYTLCAKALANGQPYFRVHIFPFRMTEGRMAREGTSTWYPFWKNLKQGYDWFEKTSVPPNVTVSGQRYVFSEQ